MDANGRVVSDNELKQLEITQMKIQLPFCVSTDMRGIGNVPVAGVLDAHGRAVANCGTGDEGHAMAAFLTLSANAFYELQDALEALVIRCDGTEGVREDGSNIDTLAAHRVLAKFDPEWAPDDADENR